jgi:DNA-binding MarR family transcriptional regulator
VVQKLEEAELLEKTTDAVDRRVVNLTLTDQGRALLSESRQRKTAWLAGRLDALDAEQRSAVVDALDVLDSLLEGDPSE